MKLKIHFLILAICLSSFGVGCKAIQRRVYRPAQTVKEFYKHLEAGNADEAAKLFHEAGIERLGGSDGFRKYITEESKAIREAGGIESLSIERESINGELASVDVLVKTRKGNGVKFRYELGWGSRSSGWKIFYSLDMFN
jgi:hypothetical protein